MTALEQQFRGFDTDGDGAIDYDEFTQGLLSLGAQITMGQIEDLITMCVFITFHHGFTTFFSRVLAWSHVFRRVFLSQPRLGRLRLRRLPGVLPLVRRRKYKPVPPSSA